MILTGSLVGEEGFEPSAYGFGDGRSSPKKVPIFNLLTTRDNKNVVNLLLNQELATRVSLDPVIKRFRTYIQAMIDSQSRKAAGPHQLVRCCLTYFKYTLNVLNRQQLFLSGLHMRISFHTTPFRLPIRKHAPSYSYSRPCLAPVAAGP